MGFLDIVMEANKKKKTVNIKTPDTKSTDYTEEVEDNQDEEETPDDEAVDAASDSADDDTPDDNEPNDYTEDVPDDDGTVESDNEEPVDGGDDLPPDNEPTDYTEDGADDSGDSTDTGDSTDSGDTDGDTPSDGDVDNAESPEGNEDDERNKRLLQEDYIDLYFRTKDFINKLSSLDKTNVILNQITVQIDKNLNRLKIALWDYVVYEYDRTSYITNLYKYNQFIEAFKANLEMLSAAREHIFKVDESESKKAKKEKSR